MHVNTLQMYYRCFFESPQHTSRNCLYVWLSVSTVFLLLRVSRTLQSRPVEDKVNLYKTKSASKIHPSWPSVVHEVWP